ncbi:DUF3329 domain-containing protein [Mycolicibacterium sp. OfavD-34-C]|uniref:DUF3329 domain-containing protein n=1 Tax=Mycolicibacterium sp. OfavD-34-C TaxID=2917746 RepID=UPI001EF6CBE6|nr:DUF3329 domain-containing protein [Mycolicibacterium sp. OfavD-34-C]MCG7578692.1 DUF3329 domain-containing protein [Mycolicibacterium sp. OfavD-34-C]
MPSTTDEDLDDQKTDTAAEDTATSDGDATEGPADAASEPGSAADGENDDAAPATPGRRRRRFLVGALAALAVAGFATSGYLGWQLWHDRQVEQAAAQAQTAAVAYAQVLTSIDSNNVDENFAQVLDGSTGEFKDMYTKSSTQLRQLLIDNEASARGVVLESAVQSASENQVVVLLFVDQSVQNASVPDPRIDRSRIKMTMDYVDGRWRASQVELP